MMEKDRSHLTERILNLTLEVIYLLTGEDHIIVKTSSQHVTNRNMHHPRGWSGIKSPIMEPPPHSLIHERNNDQKILELTNKIIQLLTGEKLEYVEECTQLCKDVKLESHQTQRSLDVSLTLDQPGGRRTSADRGKNEGNDVKGDEVEDFGSISQATETQDGSIHNLMENSISCEDGNPTVFTSDQTEYVSIVIKEETALWDVGDMYTPMGDVEPGYSSSHRSEVQLKYEWESCEEAISDTEAPTDQTMSEHARDTENGNKLNSSRALPVIKCSSCGGYFTNKSEDTFHQRTQLHKCHKCSASNSDLVERQAEDGESQVVAISEVSENSYCSHEGPHGDYVDCGKRFARNSSLDRGRQGFHSISCPVCGKWFSNSSTLVIHKRIHTGEKLFTCSECGKSFNQRANLDIHQRMHTGEKPFCCSECGKCFRSKYYLTSHQKTHTKERPFSCLECGKCFARSPNLARHQMVHTGEKPFSCAECGKYFAQRSSLDVHQRTHTGEKPYSCAECGKCFTHHSSLSVHEQCHRDEKRFSCSECGKSFTHLTSLRVHEKRHKNEKPFSCSECGKCFLLLKYLNRHFKVHRGENTS